MWIYTPSVWKCVCLLICRVLEGWRLQYVYTATVYSKSLPCLRIKASTENVQKKQSGDHPCSMMVVGLGLFVMWGPLLDSVRCSHQEMRVELTLCSVITQYQYMPVSVCMWESVRRKGLRAWAEREDIYLSVKVRVCVCVCEGCAQLCISVKVQATGKQADLKQA